MNLAPATGSATAIALIYLAFKGELKYPPSAVTATHRSAVQFMAELRVLLL